MRAREGLSGLVWLVLCAEGRRVRCKLTGLTGMRVICGQPGWQRVRTDAGGRPGVCSIGS
jgi:hypothetical protein